MNSFFLPIRIFFLIILGSAQITWADLPSNTERHLAFFREAAIPVQEAKDLAPLYEAIGDRRFVLLGEASHGTHEFYYWRSLISQQLISERGFRFVGLEGDWQAIARLNDYVKGRSGDDETALSVMSKIQRWPEWMWANQEFAAFMEWLRKFNQERELSDQVGIFGLDMQDPQDSMQAVIDWFKANQPKKLRQVIAAYRTFMRSEGFRRYVQHLSRGGERLDEEITKPLRLLQAELGATSVAAANKQLWSSIQNAKAVVRAEAQHHAMLSQSADSWNLRASHMQESFLRIAERYGDASKGIVWAHNTHVGDARATDMRAQGQVNIGQLLRESEGEAAVFILGFATAKGQVIAARDWGSERLTMQIVPAPTSTAEALMQASGHAQALWLMEDVKLAETLAPIPHRAIGVLYRPPHEAWVMSHLPRRYQALFFFEETQPLNPVEKH